MKYTERDVLQFIEENDVRFVKLVFSDMFGNQKNISINSCELRRAFADGISFDASHIDGFMNFNRSDLLLFPDPDTLALLPWRPQHGGVARLYCDIKNIDGSDFGGDGRAILRNAVDRAKKLGYTFKFGTSCEFYLFKCDDDGNPTKIPNDNAGYLDAAPIDRGENVRREICLTLEQMDIIPESSRHEGGPGQNEVYFKYSDPLNAADNLQTFQSVVKNMADKNGLYASFMPKPLEDKSGSGLHFGISMSKDGNELFQNFSVDSNEMGSSAVAGILNRVADMTVFLNPTVNSFKRFGEYLAPKYITWSHQNHAQLILVPLDKDNSARVILRSPDCACNPYLAIALLIYACLDGVEHKEQLCESVNINLVNADENDLKGIKTLPRTLDEAVGLAKKSKFLYNYMPKEIVDFFLKSKKQQYVNYKKSKDKDSFERIYFLTL